MFIRINLYHFQEIPLHVSHVTTADGQQIPYGLHVLLESMKKQYVKMVQQMQSKEYKESIQDQISKENERKDMLTKRVKQLENQIDNLIQDSLGLLKARLRELGISADTPTEFIEKAKGIVCSHNDLQKKKGGLDAEIRKLELEQDAIITKKEKEILDAVLAQRSGVNNDVNIAELRSMVKSEIKACLDGKVPTRANSPLPKVGSDVTLTKVPGPKSGVSVIELETKPTSIESIKPEPSISLPKVEMKFGSVDVSPESQAFGRSKALAAPRANDDYEDRFKKIITSELAKAGEKERGQTLVTLSPSKPNSEPDQSRSSFIPQRRGDIKTDPRAFDPGYPDSRAMVNGPPPRNDPSPRGRVISDRPGHDPRVFDPRSQDPRALDPRNLAVDQRYPPPDSRHPPPDSRHPPPDPRQSHPDLRITNSRLAEPRMSGADGAPLSREGLPSREPLHPRDGMPPREIMLPREGLPREGMIPREGLPRENMLPKEKSFAQHISSEIERSLMADRGPLPPPPTSHGHRPGSGPSPDPRPFLPQSSSSSISSVTMSSQGIMNMSVERAIQNTQNSSQTSVSRLSKVIEDSVRRDAPPEKKSIYAPNSRADSRMSNNSRGDPAEVVIEGLAMPRGSTSSPADRKPSTSLPQVEGLAARFDSYFEKEKQTTRGPPPEGLAARFSSPDPGASGAVLSRPNSTSSKSSLSLHTPDLGGPEQESRKRPAISPAPSPTPGKKKMIILYHFCKGLNSFLSFK